MTHFSPADEDFEARVRESFARQRFMQFLGASLGRIEPGFCEILLPFRDELTQQHGYFHAGVIATLADNAGGYAAYSLLPQGSSMLSVEFKLNLLSPAVGERLIAEGQVLRGGRTLSVCRCEVYAEQDGARKLAAACQMTLMTLRDRDERD